MAEQQDHSHHSHHNHHSHHSHKHHSHNSLDWATEFKHRSLNAIIRRKVIEKWLFRALVVIAIIMCIAVVVVYRLT